MNPCYFRILFVAMIGSGFALVGAIIAFIMSQTLAGVLCLLAAAVLSLSFVEYTCTRHYIPTQKHLNPAAVIPAHAPPIAVTVAQP